METFGRLLTLVMLVATIIAQPNPAFACSCMMPGPPEEAMEQAAVVFAGRVVNAEAAPEGGVVNTADLVPYTFEVSQVWKGEIESRITIGSPMSSASCGNEFVMNEEYIVYGFETDGVVQTNLCTRTAPLASAEEDLAALGEGEVPAPVEDPALVDPQPGTEVEPETPIVAERGESILDSVPLWAWIAGPALLAGAVLVVPLMRRRG